MNWIDRKIIDHYVKFYQREGLPEPVRDMPGAYCIIRLLSHRKRMFFWTLIVLFSETLACALLNFPWLLGIPIIIALTIVVRSVIDEEYVQYKVRLDQLNGGDKNGSS